jgi:hypothetical protein
MELMTFLRLQWDRVAAGVCLLGGVLAIILGWVGVSGTVHVAAQLPYFISGGLFGLFLLGVGHMLWTSADVRDEWGELRAIKELLEAQGSASRQAAPPDGQSVVADSMAEAGKPSASLLNGTSRRPAARRTIGAAPVRRTRKQAAP